MGPMVFLNNGPGPRNACKDQKFRLESRSFFLSIPGGGIRVLLLVNWYPAFVAGM